jgi:type IV pilus assembly protein PilX
VTHALLRRKAWRAGAPAAPAPGVALILALIVLALMSLSAAALMRAVDTTTAVGGNLGFRAASIPAADAAIAVAAAALSDTGVIGDRERDLPAQGYYASRQPGEDARGVPWLLQRPGRYPAEAPVLDAGEGNAVRYVIERVCVAPGPASSANCALADPRATLGSNEPAAGADPAGIGPVSAPPPVPLFRITVGVDGPQHTQSLVQAIVRGSVPPRRLSWRILAE